MDWSEAVGLPEKLHTMRAWTPCRPTNPKKSGPFAEEFYSRLVAGLWPGWIVQLVYRSLSSRTLISAPRFSVRQGLET